MSVKKAEGDARQFSTGATRQNASGKGTPVLTCPYADEELSKHFEDGASVHGARNWEKGLPVSEYINSLVRHINAFKKGLTDERHDRAIIWNAHCLVSTLAKIKLGILPADLDDMPKYEQHVVHTAAGPVVCIDDRNLPLPPGYPSSTDPSTIDQALFKNGDRAKVYVSHTIRGNGGVNATKAEMDSNCAKARYDIIAYREACPNIDFYVPAEHEDFVSIAYADKLLTEAQILEVDCKIIDKCDVVLFINHDNFFSRGMVVERRHALNSLVTCLYSHDEEGVPFEGIGSAEYVLCGEFCGGYRE